MVQRKRIQLSANYIEEKAHSNCNGVYRFPVSSLIHHIKVKYVEGQIQHSAYEYAKRQAPVRVYE